MGIVALIHLLSDSSSFGIVYGVVFTTFNEFRSQKLVNWLQFGFDGCATTDRRPRRVKAIPVILQ